MRAGVCEGASGAPSVLLVHGATERVYALDIADSRFVDIDKLGAGALQCTYAKSLHRNSIIRFATDSRGRDTVIDVVCRYRLRRVFFCDEYGHATDRVRQPQSVG